MSTMLILKNTMENIAQSIRDKMYNNANNNMFYPNEMADLINNIYDWRVEFAYGIEERNEEHQFWCGKYTTSMKDAFRNQAYRDSPIVCGNNVNDMSYAYANCVSLTNSFYIGPNVTNMSHTFENCYNIWNIPVCGNLVNDMSYAYYNCFRVPDGHSGIIEANPVTGDNVTNMSYAYYNCTHLLGVPVCGNNVKNMEYAYQDCHNLWGNAACDDNVVDMNYAYCNCYNITGSVKIGNNVVNMVGTYKDCHNITGDIIIPSIVSNITYSYENCYNLRANVTLGDRVRYMNNAFSGCRNLLNTDCESQVRTISNAYKYCVNAQGVGIIGESVEGKSMDGAYDGCLSLTSAKILTTSDSRNTGTFPFRDCWQLRDVFLSKNSGCEQDPNYLTYDKLVPDIDFIDCISLKNVMPWYPGYFSPAMYSGSPSIEGNVFSGSIYGRWRELPSRSYRDDSATPGFMTRLNLSIDNDCYDVVSNTWNNTMSDKMNLICYRLYNGNVEQGLSEIGHLMVNFPKREEIGWLNIYSNLRGDLGRLFESVPNTPGAAELKSNNYPVPGCMESFGTIINFETNAIESIRYPATTDNIVFIGSRPDPGTYFGDPSHDCTVEFPDFRIRLIYSENYRYEQFYPDT